jgi:hypothetical protein
MDVRESMLPTVQLVIALTATTEAAHARAFVTIMMEIARASLAMVSTMYVKVGISRVVLAAQNVVISSASPAISTVANGINVPALGLGICTGEYQGCQCSMVCPEGDLDCSNPNCFGNNGVCAAGIFNGCNCVNLSPLSISPSIYVEPTPTTTISTPATAAAQGYSSGICSIHVKEESNCNPSDSDLFGYVTIKDFEDKVLCGGSDHRASLNDKNPANFACELPNPITITGEHVDDYVQFTYGSLSWRSTDNVVGKAAWCKTGSWDDSGKHCPTGSSVSFSPFYDRGVELTFTLGKVN